MVLNNNLIVTAHLRKDARVKLTTLARKTGMAVSTLFERIHDLDALGITRLAALLDFHVLGYTTHAVLLLKGAKDGREKLKEFLLNSGCVNSLMRVNNGYDFLTECVFKDLRELEGFCDELEVKQGVKDKEIHFIIEELRRESFLNDPKEIKRG